MDRPRMSMEIYIFVKRHNGYYTLDILYIAAYYARCGHFWNFINTVYQLVTTSIVAKLLDRDDYANKIDVFLGTVEEG